jgi:hypothetical protein
MNKKNGDAKILFTFIAIQLTITPPMWFTKQRKIHVNQV